MTLDQNCYHLYLTLNFNEPVEYSINTILENASREFVVYVVLTSMSYVIEDYSTGATRDIDILNLMLDLATRIDDTYLHNTCIAGNLIAPEMLLIAENFTGDIPEMSLIAENFTGDITSPDIIYKILSDGSR